MADWAFDQLRSAVFDGELKSGDRLSVPALAEQLHVSRSPVREAVQRLVREGLAVEMPHRGAVVADYGAEDMVEIYEIREVLEGLVARLAAERADATLIDELDEVHTRHREVVKSGDQSGHIAHDMRFHQLLREAAGSPWLTDLLDQIRGKIQLAMLSTSLGGGREQAVREHERILEAVRAHDGVEAEQAARAHIERLRLALADRADASAQAEAGEQGGLDVRVH